MATIGKNRSDPDVRKGAIEGDRPDDEQHANRNAPALTDDGLPDDPIAIAEDRLGANVDDSEVSHAGETGHSSETLRDEELELE